MNINFLVIDKENYNEKLILGNVRKAVKNLKNKENVVVVRSGERFMENADFIADYITNNFGQTIKAATQRDQRLDYITDFGSEISADFFSNFLDALKLISLKKEAIEEYNSDNMKEFLEDSINFRCQNVKLLVLVEPEMIKIMQKNDKIRKLCYFGDEKFGLLGNATKSKMHFDANKMYSVEIDTPLEIGYDGAVYSIAQRKLMEQMREK